MCACVRHTLWWLQPSLCSLSTRLFPETLSKPQIEDVCDTPHPWTPKARLCRQGNLAPRWTEYILEWWVTDIMETPDRPIWIKVLLYHMICKSTVKESCLGVFLVLPGQVSLRRYSELMALRGLKRNSVAFSEIQRYMNTFEGPQCFR